MFCFYIVCFVFEIFGVDNSLLKISCKHIYKLMSGLNTIHHKTKKLSTTIPCDDCNGRQTSNLASNDYDLLNDSDVELQYYLNLIIKTL